MRRRAAAAAAIAAREGGAAGRAAAGAPGPAPPLRRARPFGAHAPPCPGAAGGRTPLPSSPASYPTTNTLPPPHTAQTRPFPDTERAPSSRDHGLQRGSGAQKGTGGPRFFRAASWARHRSGAQISTSRRPAGQDGAVTREERARYMP
jgi:hypothetical protein